MTIAMAVVDPPYALVATDRRSTNFSRDPSGQPQISRGESFAKVHAHTTLPVVWVSAGLVYVNHQGQRRAVDELIREAWVDLPIGRPINETVVRALEFLEPLVQDEAAAPEYAHLPDPMGVNVLIGMGVQGFAGGAHVSLGFGGAAAASPISESCITFSPHTRAFVEGLPRDEWAPRRGSNPAQIAEYMRRLLGRAIDAAQQLAGDQADVGDGVDVAMVGPSGARILPASSRPWLN